jgi:hypothetical protein
MACQLGDACEWAKAEIELPAEEPFVQVGSWTVCETCSLLHTDRIVDMQQSSRKRPAGPNGAPKPKRAGTSSGEGVEEFIRDKPDFEIQVDSEGKQIVFVHSLQKTLPYSLATVNDFYMGKKYQMAVSSSNPSSGNVDDQLSAFVADKPDFELRTNSAGKPEIFVHSFGKTFSSLHDVTVFYTGKKYQNAIANGQVHVGSAPAAPAEALGAEAVADFLADKPDFADFLADKPDFELRYAGRRGECFVST